MEKSQDILQRIARSGVVAVGVVEDPADAVPVGEALLAGGVDCFEITMRTSSAAEAIRRMTSVPGLLPGAGTVLTVDQAKAAVESGARFLVSPGADLDVVRYCAEQGIAITPGVATPSEIQICLREGLTMLKLFPAAALGGPAYIKAVGAPFSNVRFIPTGGVTAANLAEYLRLPNVAACGGTWLVPRDVVKAKRFGEVTRLAAEAAAVVKQCRGGTA